MKSSPARSHNRDIFLKLFGFGLVAILIGWLGYRAIVEKLFPAFSLQYSEKVDWSLLGGYASVISLVILIGGLAFAFAEYADKENAKHREKARLSHDIYQTIFEKLTAPEQEAARRWILANISVRRDDEEITTWYEKTNTKIMAHPKGMKADVPEGQRSVKLTLNCFDYIGFIAIHYWDIDADSLDWISPPIAKVWKRIGPYVGHVRTLRKAKDYYLSAEYIGNRCIRWRQERGLPDEEYAKETL